MKFVHGKFNSFKEMGAALGVKHPKDKADKVKKCEECGANMHRVGGSNVWTCGTTYLVDKKLGDKDVQVFGICRNTILSED